MNDHSTAPVASWQGDEKKRSICIFRTLNRWKRKPELVPWEVLRPPFKFWFLFCSFLPPTSLQFTFHWYSEETSDTRRELFYTKQLDILEVLHKKNGFPLHKSLQNMLTFSLLCSEPTTSLLKQQRNQFDIKWNYGFLSGEISSPHHRRGLDLSAFLHAAVREHCPASFGPLPKAKFCSSLIPVHILFIPVTRGGGAAHLKQVEQRDSETEATCCILNFPGFLINPHFVTTINSLFQILGILEIKNSLKFFFFWGEA